MKNKVIWQGKFAEGGIPLPEEERGEIC